MDLEVEVEEDEVEVKWEEANLKNVVAAVQPKFTPEGGRRLAGLFLYHNFFPA